MDEPCPSQRDVPLAKPSGDEDPPVSPEDLRQSGGYVSGSALLGNRISFPESGTDSLRKSGSPRIGASAQHSTREIPGLTAGVAAMERGFLVPNAAGFDEAFAGLGGGGRPANSPGKNGQSDGGGS